MIKDILNELKMELPATVKLVAVSKFHPFESIVQAYEAGQRVFAESRPQEFLAKIRALEALREDLVLRAKAEGGDAEAARGYMSDIEWHFIGHLQTNKVRQLLRLRPAMIESVDSLRLLHIIDREALAAGIVQPVLMQVHVAREETKTGFSPDELLAFFRSRGFEELRATHICGVMGMASNTDDEARVEADFRAIRSCFDEILRIAPDLRGFSTVSMGMSGDYPLAIDCGANLVRVGTAIFGDRQY